MRYLTLVLLLVVVSLQPVASWAQATDGISVTPADSQIIQTQMAELEKRVSMAIQTYGFVGAFAVLLFLGTCVIMPLMLMYKSQRETDKVVKQLNRQRVQMERMLEEANRMLGKMKELDQEAQSNAMFAAAMSLQMEGQNGEALTLLSDLQKQNPDDPTILTNQAINYAHMSQTDTAIQCLLKAIETDQNYAPARFNLAIMYHEEGMFKEALEAVNDGLRIRPHEKNALNLKKEIEREIWIQENRQPEPEPATPRHEPEVEFVDTEAVA